MKWTIIVAAMLMVARGAPVADPEAFVNLGAIALPAITGSALVDGLLLGKVAFLKAAILANLLLGDDGSAGGDDYGVPDAAPVSSYGAPVDSYGAPAVAYEEPSVSYGAPAAPSYSAPSYEEPAAPSYSAPSYEAPSYEAPAQDSYGAPAAQPVDSYGSPASNPLPSYGAPSY